MLQSPKLIYVQNLHIWHFVTQKYPEVCFIAFALTAI